MREAIHELFSEAVEAIWRGLLSGVWATAALTVVYFAVRGMSSWATALKAVVQ